MKNERVLCASCNKQVKPQFQEKTQIFICPKCGRILPLAKSCRRKIVLFRLIFNMVAFGLILLSFAIFMHFKYSVIAVIVAVISAPVASKLDGYLVNTIFFKHNRYTFESSVQKAKEEEQ